MSSDRLSLGSRQLLTFLARRIGSKGYCWYKQSTIARNMERSLRTVNRQIAELVTAKKLFTNPHGHGNHYSLQDLWEKVAYQQPAVEKPLESAPVGVAAAPNWRSAPSPVFITETEESEEKLAEQRASFPRSESQEDKTNPWVSVDFIGFIREQTRFSIRGKMADEGTIRRLAVILQDRDGCDAWQARSREWLRRNKPDGWGILVVLARDVASERAQFAEEYLAYTKLATAVTTSIPKEPSDATDSLYPPEVMAERARREEAIQRAEANGWSRVDPKSECENCHGYGLNIETGELCDCGAGQLRVRRQEWCEACRNEGAITDPFDGALFAWCNCIHAVRLREQMPNWVDESNRVIHDLRAQFSSPNGRKAGARPHERRVVA